MPSIQSTLPDTNDDHADAKLNRYTWLSGRLLPVLLFFASGIALIVLVGVAQRLDWIKHPQTPVAPAADSSAGTIYTCPMHPNIRQPSPGRCPICGMELVLASSASAGALDELAVRIEPAQRRLANIQTAEVKAAPVEDSISGIGVIAIDESRQATIAAYVDGRLERLFADYTGVRISQGDHLAVIYSPQLFGAQVEYLEFRRTLNVTGGLGAIRETQKTLAENARQRLREFGMTQDQLEALERTGQAETRLTIYSPQAGTVVEKLAVEGDYVKAGDAIYRVAELSTVWLMLKLFPEDAARIRFGQRVEATVQSLPDQTFIGRVAFIDPTVDARSRTVNVRVELSNDKGQLRPGDYAEAVIKLPIAPQGNVYDADLAGKWISPMHPQVIRDEPGKCPICGMDLVPTTKYGYSGEPVPQPSSIFVPRSAVLLAGDNSVAYVETEPGRFEIRPVNIGPILKDKIVVLGGLKPGENVATSGNFLIDSQMQLAGKPSVIDPARAIAKNQPRTGPLVFNKVEIKPVDGEMGKKLESLYAAYFTVHKNLAADQKPESEAAHSLTGTAKQLSEETALPEAAQKLLLEIATNAEHLHHMDLVGARKAFKPISHAVVTLATQIRGGGARQPFIHFYCPMVPGGGGDWLQPDGQLLNPYFGSQMLRCGAKITEYPPTGAAPTQGDSHEQHDMPPPDNRDA